MPAQLPFTPLDTENHQRRDHYTRGAVRLSGSNVPVLPSWLTEPLWDQFSALLPARPVFHPAHPLGCHRRRIGDRTVFDKLLQVLRFGCSYEAVADATCSASTIRARRMSGYAWACSPG